MGIDDEADGIDTIQNSKFIIQDEGEAWFTLDGRKLDSKPQAKGLYIYKGKKVIIK